MSNSEWIYILEDIFQIASMKTRKSKVQIVKPSNFGLLKILKASDDGVCHSEILGF
jgi:hypothetical protein